MPRTQKHIAIGLGIALGLPLSVLIALPVLFGDRIASRVKTEVNRAVNAKVDWTTARVGLLRTFPNVNLSLDHLTVVGAAPFEHDTLIAIRRASITLDLASVVAYLRKGQPIMVRDVSLEQPTITLRRLANGTANWAIARKQADSTSARAVGVTLRRLRINDGNITLDDRAARLVASVRGLEQSLSGDFAKDNFTLATRTRIDSASVRFGGVPYLRNVAIQLNATVAADLAAHRFTFTNDSLRLNTLVLALAGTVTTGTPDLGLDVTVSAPSTAFSQVLSLLPAVYTREFEQLETAGIMSVSGRVRGAYGPRAFPALALRARVDGGSFRYPGRDVGVRDIAFDLAITNPGGHVDSTVVDLSRFHATIADRPVDARVVVRTPVSDPDVDLRVRGDVDLADVARVVPLDGATRLTGLVSADITMRARLSDIDARRYDRVSAAGAMQATHVTFNTPSWAHPIAIDTAALHFTPRTAALTAFAATVGKTDVRATGSLDNLLGFVLRDDDLRGIATVTSNHVALDEWITDTTSDVVLVPPRIDVTVNAAATRVTFGALSAANVRGGVRVKNRRATLDQLRLEMFRGTLVANGSYETLVAERPSFGMQFQLTGLDIPTAFVGLTSMQTLAPIARWAEGAVSGTLALRGVLGRDMTPVFTTLAGQGAIETERLLLNSAPILESLASAFAIDQLRGGMPGLEAIRAAFDVSDGRVRVKPFAVKANDMEMTIGGSHGIDQSLSYDVALAVPRRALGAAGELAIAKLAARAGAVGLGLPAGDVVKLRAHVAGTLSKPTITANFAGMAASVADAANEAAQQLVTASTATVKQKVDSAVTDVVRRAHAEADRIVADAERQADSIRTTARSYADKLRTESNARIDSLVARATNPVARLAAQRAADRLRAEANQQTSRAIREADERADALVVQAKQRASALIPPA